jgi:hypothetical protein
MFVKFAPRTFELCLMQLFFPIEGVNTVLPLRFIGSSTMVEQTPHHPKVKVWSPATAYGAQGDRKMIRMPQLNKLVFVPEKYLHPSLILDSQSGAHFNVSKIDMSLQYSYDRLVKLFQALQSGPFSLKFDYSTRPFLGQTL